MKVVLYQPQIPQNTGNIVRTCSVAGSDLILVPPMGFSLSDRQLKRAGLDYWEGVNVTICEDFEKFLEEENSFSNFYFFSSRATRLYTEVPYSIDSLLIFGSETAGLPQIFWQKWPQHFVQIPMLAGKRCLNLATSVGIGVYEALRTLRA